MNLEDQYHAAAMLRITQEDARRIAELEAERDNAWEELREIRAAISANPEESTLDEVVKLRQQLAAAQDEIDEQARIVGMGGEREIDLRQKLDIVSSLLREAAGRMSYGHWSSEFRGRVESALKTKGPKL